MSSIRIDLAKWPSTSTDCEFNVDKIRCRLQYDKKNFKVISNNSPACK